MWFAILIPLLALDSITGWNSAVYFGMAYGVFIGVFLDFPDEK